MKTMLAMLFKPRNAAPAGSGDGDKLHVQKMENGLYGVFVGTTFISTHPDRESAEASCQKLHRMVASDIGNAETQP